MLESLNIGFLDVVNIATGIIDWLVFFFVIAMIGKKKSNNIKYIGAMIFILIFMGIVNGYRVLPNIKIIMCMILGTLFYIRFYKDKVYKSIIVSLLFWLGLMLAEGLSFGILVMLNPAIDSSIMANDISLRIQGIIISKILLFVVVILFKYFKLSLEFKPKDMVLIGIPILSNIFCLLIMFEYNVMNVDMTRNGMFIFIFATILIVSASIVLLVVVGKIVKDDKLKLEYELINERIKTNHKSYENINEIHDKLKYIYHDLKNHMVCIKGYDTKEEVISYIDNLENQIGDFEHFKNTGNKTLDIILGEKIYQCKKYNIEFEDNINLSKLDFIKDIDICAIFANAIDNAIEACMGIDNEIDKRIDVKATYINGFAIIKFTNTKVNDIKFVDERIQTSKKDDKIHGIGLASIKYIVNKYDGETIVNYSNNEFILKIMIPINNLGETINEKNSVKAT